MEIEAETDAAGILRRNERVKAASNVTTNLGTAVLAAIAARWYAIGFDPLVVVWLAGGAMIIWTGIHILAALEVEKGCG